jgi:hypothetical protein
LKQSPSLAQGPPAELFLHTPPAHWLVQQSSSMTQLWPALRVHEHFCPKTISVRQSPLQQPPPAEQALLLSMQQAALTQLDPAAQAGMQAALERQLPPDCVKPASQAMPQLVPSQTA